MRKVFLRLTSTPIPPLSILFFVVGALLVLNAVIGALDLSTSPSLVSFVRYRALLLSIGVAFLLIALLFRDARPRRGCAESPQPGFPEN